ncbi:MAG: hypothetical protein P8077_01080 [Gammaproteobacteria bacterium]
MSSPSLDSNRAIPSQPTASPTLSTPSAFWNKLTPVARHSTFASRGTAQHGDPRISSSTNHIDNITQTASQQQNRLSS